MQDWLFVNLILCLCSGYGTGLSNSPVPTACCCCCLFSTCTLRSSLAILSLKYFAIFSHRRRGKRKMKQFTVICSRSYLKQRKGAMHRDLQGKPGKSCPHPNQGACVEWRFLSLSKGQTSRGDAADPEQFGPRSVLAVIHSGVQLWWCCGLAQSLTYLAFGRAVSWHWLRLLQLYQPDPSWASAHLAEPHSTRTGCANETRLKESCEILQTCLQLQLSCKPAPADAHGRRLNGFERSISKASI